jgi:hypothetical protein
MHSWGAYEQRYGIAIALGKRHHVGDEFLAKTPLGGTAR